MTMIDSSIRQFIHDWRDTPISTMAKKRSWRFGSNTRIELMETAGKRFPRAEVVVHGNIIAQVTIPTLVRDRGLGVFPTIWIGDCGWATPLTERRLEAVLFGCNVQAFHALDLHISSNKPWIYLDGIEYPWEGSLVFENPYVTVSSSWAHDCNRVKRPHTLMISHDDVTRFVYPRYDIRTGLAGRYLIVSDPQTQEAWLLEPYGSHVFSFLSERNVQMWEHPNPAKSKRVIMAGTKEECEAYCRLLEA